MRGETDFDTTAGMHESESGSQCAGRFNSRCSASGHSPLIRRCTTASFLVAKKRVLEPASPPRSACRVRVVGAAPASSPETDLINAALAGPNLPSRFQDFLGHVQRQTARRPLTTGQMEAVGRITGAQDRSSFAAINLAVVTPPTDVLSRLLPDGRAAIAAETAVLVVTRTTSTAAQGAETHRYA